MEESAQNKNSYTKAKWLQRAANGLSYARMFAAPLIFARIARGEHRNMKTAAAIGALAITDGLDGKLARKAAATDTRVKNERGAWLDQMADKVLTHSILGGLFIDGMRTRRYKSGTAFLTNQAVQAIRDTWVTNVRKEAAAYDVATGAQQLGKIKTGVLLCSSVILASPVAKTSVGDAIGAAGIHVGTALSVVSGASLVNSLRQGIEVARQTENEAHLTDAPHAIEVA